MNIKNNKPANKEIEKLIQICKETQMQDPEKCLITGKKILELALINQDIENEGIAYRAIGLGFMNQRKYIKAIECFKNVVTRRIDFSEFNYFIPIHNAIGHCYWRNGNKKEALKFFKQTLELNIQKDDKTEIAKDQVNLGALYLQMGDYDRSIEYNNEALKCFKKLKNVEGIGFAYGNLGNCYHYLGKYEEGIECNLKAISYAKKNNNLPSLGRSLQAASSLFQKVGNFNKAVECALESLTIKKKLNENPINVLISLGIIYKEWNNHKKAMEYNLEALKLCIQEKDESNTSRVMNNIGNIYMEKKDNSEALLYYQKALKLHKKLKDKHGMMIVLNNIGLIYSESTENWVEAEESFNESIRISEELKLYDETIAYSLSLTDLLIIQNKFEEAENLLNRCSDNMQNIQSYKFEMNYFLSMIKLYEKQKNFEKAFFWQSKLSERKDKIFTEENQKKIAEMQTKYETEQKEKEAEIYRLKTVELEKKNKQIRKQKVVLEKTLEELSKSEIKYNLIEEEYKKNIDLDLIGESHSINKIKELISIVAISENTNVLITGESGTGKEIVARQIHQNSVRHNNSFCGINSSAVPGTLFESQFFGHEKNAFTGANKTHIGWFEIADGGTLFLDEIGTMSLDQQVKLLRVLEERKIIRLGSHREIPIDVHIISASNIDLVELVETNVFRKDLYHRLATFVIRIPPLRERKDDIPLLLEHFVNLFSLQLKKKIKKIEKSVEEALMKYHFPGNVRELKNIIERAMIVTDSSTLKLSHFSVPKSANKDNHKDFLPMSEIEKLHITEALKISKYNQSHAADLLKIERRAVARKMKKYGIER